MTSRSDALLDPFGPEGLVDPHPFYDRLRALEPAVLLPERDVWMVSTYDAVRHVLRNPAQFRSGAGTGYLRVDSSGLRGPLIDSDPPVHTTIRRSLQRWFTPSAIAARRPSVRAIVDTLVGEAAPRGDIDAVTALAQPLPVAVMAELMGMDHPEPSAVGAMMDGAFHLLGPDPTEDHRLRLGEMAAWFFGGGITQLHDGGLAQAIMADEDTDIMDRVGLIGQMWIAGVDTTTNLIGSVLHALSEHPEQWRLLTADPTLADAAVEEALRFASPIQFFMRRTVEVTDLLGVTIPADADVCVLFASANRDEGHYPDADRFDVLRRPDDHLAFGSGIHLCLGAPVLRLAVGELLRAMATTVEGITSNGPPVRNPSPVIQGFRSVPLRLTPSS